MLNSTLQDIFLFSDYCWESSSGRIKNIALKLIEKQRVYLVEPPILGMTSFAQLNEFYSPDGVIVLTPYLPLKTNESDKNTITSELLQNFIDQENILYFKSWYFSSAAWDFSKDLGAKSIIMDVEREDQLQGELAREADYIFAAHPMNDPRCMEIADGVDFEHFAQARLSLIRPDDLEEIPAGPRIGCYGVYDNTMIEKIAQLRPELQFIFLQPPGEIELPNVHYLGVKNFYSLPLYISHWDIALTQLQDKHLLELLSAGKPTICLNKKAVVAESLIFKAEDADELSKKIDEALEQNTNDPHWIDRVDQFLQTKSWEHQVNLMLEVQSLEELPMEQQVTLTQ